MKPQNHVPVPMLMDFASAQLSPPFSYVVGCHVHNCRLCRAYVADFLALGGAVLDELMLVEMETSAQDVLRKINLSSASVDPVSEIDTHPAEIPLKGGLFDEKVLKGFKFQALAPGIRQHFLEVEGEKPSKTSPRIIWFDAGVSVSAHGHGGVELTQVLVGGYYDGAKAFKTGDIQVVNHVASHQPTAMNDGSCLVLVVTDTPIKFQQTIPRILQRFFKI